MGCSPYGRPLGYIGRPRDFLSTYNDQCKSGGPDCFEKGKQACDAILADGGDCIGFALISGWGVQMYNSNGRDTSKCNSDDGLTDDMFGSTTYVRSSSYGASASTIAGIERGLGLGKRRG